MNAGCIPTKALVRVAELVYLARRPQNGALGFTVERVHVDFPRVIARKDAVVADVVERLTSSLEAAQNIDLLRGTARFADPRTVLVDERRVSARSVIVSTGSRPVLPEIPGAGETGYVTSTSIMHLARLPARLVAIGGGPIAMEFAQMFARFGSEVTVLFRGDRVLPREEDEIGDALTSHLEREGVRMVRRARVLRMERGSPRDGGPRVVFAEVDGVERAFAADEVLAAIGREPNGDALGLNEAGIATSPEGWIRADATMRTSVPGIFAAGDAIGHESGSQLYTHVAVNQGGLAARNAVRGTHERFGTHALPGAVFTEPEVARVGLTEGEARAAGLATIAASYPYSRVGRARAMGETEGLFKVVLDARTRRILGFHAFGAAAGELVHIAAVAMASPGASAQPILDAIFIHPTLAEGVQSVFEEAMTNVPPRMAH